ncbi:MAG: 16S rRNA processing protein RimM [Burkholderiales bacterium]|nr:16S rRNA processing protein RimM [Burkholderiales bacterium]
MGRVVGPWGVRGWIKVAPWGAGPAGLAAQRSWWMRPTDGEWRNWAVTEAKVHGNAVVAAVGGCVDPESAARFKGWEIAVPRSALPPPERGEVYLDDLVGLDVMSVTGADLGRVGAIDEFGAHPLLRVEKDGAKRLIPCVAPILRSIDLEAGRIEVDWEPDY